MTSICFATPCYRCNPRVRTGLEAWAGHMAIELRLSRAEFVAAVDNPWIDSARADLVASFRASGCDALFFRDDDIDLEAELLERMLADLRHKPIVIAPYRMRLIPHQWTITFDGSRVVSAGLGACLISREAIETMIGAFPELEYDQDGSKRHALFLHEIRGGRLLKEDEAFFTRAIAAGLEVHAIPNARVDHGGVVSFWEGKL